MDAIARGAESDWVYLTGPAGTGKTHLALAVCAAAEGAGRSAAYLPLFRVLRAAGERVPVTSDAPLFDPATPDFQAVLFDLDGTLADSTA